MAISQLQETDAFDVAIEGPVPTLGQVHRRPVRPVKAGFVEALDPFRRARFARELIEGVMS